jgi:hypothetical protein
LVVGAAQVLATPVETAILAVQVVAALLLGHQAFKDLAVRVLPVKALLAVRVQQVAEILQVAAVAALEP